MKNVGLELNVKEAEVLRHFPTPKNDEELGEPVTLADLAREAFPKKGVAPTTKGNSWVRNSLRKLLRLKLVKHGGAKSGKYMRTSVTLSDIKKEIEAKAAEKAARLAAKEAKKKVKKTKPKKAEKAEKADQESAVI